MNSWKKQKKLVKDVLNLLLFNYVGLFVIYIFMRIFFLLFPFKDLRLHLGCGTKRRKGFINIDRRISRATDLILDIKKLPFRKNSVRRIETHHLIEHIPHPDVGPMLDEWWRVLDIGGMLVIECPNVDETMREYLAGNEKRLYNIYGLQRYKGDFHFFGYNPKRLARLLESHGFIQCTNEEPTDYHREQEPCMRMTAIKGTNGRKSE